MSTHSYRAVAATDAELQGRFFFIGLLKKFPVVNIVVDNSVAHKELALEERFTHEDSITTSSVATGIIG